MASSPKKGHRPPVRHVQPAHAAVVAEEPAAPPASDISAAALQAAEVLPPVVEAPEAPPAEVLEAPVAEFAPAPADIGVEPPAAIAAEPAAPQFEDAPSVAAASEPAVEIVAEPAAPPLAEAPSPVAAPEPVEAVAPAEAPAAVKEFGGNVRALVEKGLVESRAKFAQAKTVAEETSAAVEASYGAARDGVVALNLKAIEAFKASADANFDLVVALALAKTMSELVTLQSEFARKRFEETSSQAKAMAELARKVADEAVAPIKAHVAKTFKVAV